MAPPRKTPREIRTCDLVGCNVTFEVLVTSQRRYCTKSHSHIGKHHSPKTIIQMSKTAEKTWEDPDIRKKRIDAYQQAGEKRQVKADTSTFRLLSHFGLRTFRDFVKAACKMYNISYKEASTRIRAELKKNDLTRLDIVLFLFYTAEGRSVSTCAFRLNISENVMYQRLAKIKKLFPDVFQLGTPLTYGMKHLDWGWESEEYKLVDIMFNNIKYRF